MDKRVPSPWWLRGQSNVLGTTPEIHGGVLLALRHPLAVGEELRDVGGRHVEVAGSDVISRGRSLSVRWPRADAYPESQALTACSVTPSACDASRALGQFRGHLTEQTGSSGEHRLS